MGDSLLQQVRKETLLIICFIVVTPFKQGLSASELERAQTGMWQRIWYIGCTLLWDMSHYWHSDFGSLQDDVSPIKLGRTISLRLDIPPVAPGYRRTPYLLRLMSCLNRHPTADVSIYSMPFKVMISHGCHSM